MSRDLANRSALGLAVLVATHAAAAAPPPPAPPPSPAAAPTRTRLVILDLAANDVDAGLVKTISDSIAVTLQQARIVDDVASAADLRAMMNVEVDKRSMGVDCDAKESCMAEVAQALGADVLVHGSVGRYGALYAVTLSLFDAHKSRAIAREKTETDKLELLPRRVEFAAKRLALAYEGKSLDLAGPEPTGAQAIGAPLLWTGVAVGAVGAAGCVIGTALALSASATLSDPLSSGANKATAETSQPLYTVAAVGGGVAAVAGAGVAALSFFVE